MKTKTLLIAAAALAAGVVTSQAQVYSQNIVGYVNVVVPPSPGWACVANPFNLDGTNAVSNVIPTPNAPKGTKVELFSPTSGFSTTIQVNNFSGVWGANAATNYIPPGVGFMIQGGTTGFTNTFVGSIVVPNGGTNSMTLSRGLYQLVGSPIPYAGDLTNSTSSGPGTLNLAGMPNGTQIQVWNNGFTVASTKNQFSGVWSPDYNFSVGQGFIIKPAGTGTTNWDQVLSNP